MEDSEVKVTAQQFREQYAKDHGYEEWGLMHMETKDLDKLEDDLMSAYLKAKLEEVRDSLAKMGYQNSKTDKLFDQAINELK